MDQIFKIERVIIDLVLLRVGASHKRSDCTFENNNGGS